MPRLWGGIGLGLLAAALFSCKAIIVKLAYRYGVDAETLIGLRMVFAAPFFALAALLTWIKDSDGTRWKKHDPLKIMLLGAVGYYAASYLDFLGLKYISAGLERIILYLTPSIVLLISAFWFRRKPAGREIVSLIVIYLGVVIAVWGDLSLGGTHVLLGSALVLASAFCYALYLTASGEMVTRLGSIRLTAWAMLVSTVFCILQALVLSPQSMLAQPSQVYWLSLINAFFCTVLPVFLTMMAIEKAGSPVIAQTGMVGPVVTIFLAASLLSEPVTALQLIGSVIIIVGIFVLSTKPGKTDSSSASSS